MNYTRGMRVLGRRIPNFWLALAIPAAVCLAPLLLILFFAANNLAGAVAGPPAIWNRPCHKISVRELAGSYAVSGRSRGTEFALPNPASLALSADGSMRVEGLPGADCTMTGSGQWRVTDDEGRIDLLLTSPAEKLAGVCGPHAGWTVIAEGHAPPYKLYWVIDDPDSGTGLWLIQR